MMFRTWLDSCYTDLEDWLTIATSGFSDGARARIAEEMGEHYAEAVSALVARGVTKECAEADALKELGPPQHARRVYQRNYARQRHFLSSVDVLQRCREDLATAKAYKHTILPREIFAVLLSAVYIVVPLFVEAAMLSFAYPQSLIVVGALLVIGFSFRVARRVSERWGDLAGYRVLYGARACVLTFLCSNFVAGSLTVDAGGLFIPMYLTMLAWGLIFLARSWNKVRPMLSG